MKSKIAKQIAIGLFSIFFTTMSFAACTNTGNNRCDVRVTATIVPGCTVEGPSGKNALGTIGKLDFGVHGLSNKKVSATLEHSVAKLKCTPGTKVTVSIDGGQHQKSGVRRMRHAKENIYVDYRLYGHNDQLFTINKAQQVRFAKDGKVQIYVKGEADLKNNLSAGLYTDRLLVTLSY